MPNDQMLGIVLLLTNAFWAWNTHRLINKLMSRNYFEVKQAGLQPEEKPKPLFQVPPDESEDYGAISELTN